MPNGTDCSAVLQTEAVCVPTQWVVVDCTTDGRVAAWLKADVAGEIDYVHAWRGVSGGGTTGVVGRVRPGVLHALYDAHDRRVAAGSKGRLVVWFVADLGNEAGNRLLAELPLDVANAMFWKARVVPAVIRVGLGGDDADRRRYLSPVRDQYFGTPEFSGPYYGKHEAGRVYGNAFDSTLLCQGDEQVRGILGELVPLHLEEARFARSHLGRHAAGGIMVIERVMAESRRWRRIDWLAVTAYPFFRRLWDAAGRDDILDVLDYRRCPGREQDPWAALKGRSREKNWDALRLDLTPFDPSAGEEAYRVTPGDHRTRLWLAGFLAGQAGHQAEALRQCEVGRAEGGYDADGQWLKYEALARHGLGEEAEARRLFGAYRRRLEEVEDPPAHVLDEIGTMALVEGDHALAYESARRAVAKDRFLGHAYDTMVLAGRESGNAQYEREAAELAARNGVTVPVHVREKTAQVIRGAKVVKAPPANGPNAPKQGRARAAKRWWQFWR